MFVHIYVDGATVFVFFRSSERSSFLTSSIKHFSVRVDMSVTILVDLDHTNGPRYFIESCLSKLVVLYDGCFLLSIHIFFGYEYVLQVVVLYLVSFVIYGGEREGGD